MATDTDPPTAAQGARATLTAEVARVAAGDRDALRRVHAATAAKLFGICLRITGDRDAAEDALQDTYLKIWRRADRFDADRASAITWMCLIARGTAIDARRVTVRAAAGLDAARDDAATGAVGPANDARVIADCLDRLDAAQRRYIRSAYFDGYSYAELAAAAEVPLPTMKSRIRRGLLALRRCLDDA